MIQVEKLPDIFHRIAHIHDNRMAEHTLNREIPVADDVVAKTSLSEMKWEEIADIAASFKLFREHILAIECFYRGDF